MTQSLHHPNSQCQLSVNIFLALDRCKSKSSAAFLTRIQTMGHLSRQNLVSTSSLLCRKNDCQLGVNNFWTSILENQGAVWGHEHIIEQSAACVGKNVCNNISIMS